MKFDFLKRICCPPEYITMPHTGVEIGNRFIRFAEFKNRKGEIILSNFGEIILSPDTVKDGQIINRDALIKAFKVLKERISSDFISVSVPEEKTYIFNTQIPKLKNSEIRSALEFKLEENVPLKTDESVFEYENIKGQDSHTDINLNVSVIPKAIIESYLEVIESVGLHVISFELESKMLAKSVVSNASGAAVLVINIKNDSTVLSVVTNGVVRFSSTVSVGESAMLEGLRKMKKENSVPDKIPSSFLDLGDSIDSETFDSLLNVYSILKDEVEKFNEYWLNLTGSSGGQKAERLHKIVFCGRSAALPGLMAHINQNIAMDVSLANVWVNVIDINKSIPNIGFVDSLDYGVAVGLAMPCKK